MSVERNVWRTTEEPLFSCLPIVSEVSCILKIVIGLLVQETVGCKPNRTRILRFQLFHTVLIWILKIVIVLLVQETIGCKPNRAQMLWFQLLYTVLNASQQLIGRLTPQDWSKPKVVILSTSNRKTHTKLIAWGFCVVRCSFYERWFVGKFLLSDWLKTKYILHVINN